MAGELATVYVNVVASTGGLGRQLQGEAGSAGQASGTTTGKKFGGAFASVVKKAGLIGAGVTAALAAKGGISRALSIEDAQAKLSGLGHSTKSVTQIMDNAMASVKGTAFGMGDAATVAAGVVAAGVKPGQELERTLKLVGDSATIAGTGMGEMGGIFNKVAASGKIQGDVIAQLNDAGIPIVQLLGEQLGTTAEETVKLASAGKIGFGTFQDAMEKGLGGAALKSGETFRGSMANLKAALGRIGETVMSPFLDGIKAGANRLIPIFDGFNAALKPIMAKVGPLFSGAISGIGPALSGAWQAIQPFLQAMQNAFGPAVEAVVSAFKPLGSQLGQIFQGFSPLTLIMKAIEPLLPLIAQAFQALGEAVAQIIPQLAEIAVKIQSALVPVISQVISTLLPPLINLFKQVAPILAQVVQALVPLVDAILNILMPVIRALLPVVQTVFGSLITIIQPILDIILNVIKTVTAVLTGDWTAAWEGIKGIFKGVWDLIVGIVTVAIDLVKSLLSAELTIISGIWNGMWSGISSFFSGIWNGIVSFVTTYINNVKLVITTVVNEIKTVWTNIWNTIKTVISTVWEGIVSFVRTYINTVKTVITTVMNTIKNVWTTVWNNIKNFIGGIWEGINKGVSDGIAGVVKFFSGLWDKITGALGDMGAKMLKVGEDMMQGFINGIGNAAQWVNDKIGDVVNGAIGWAKDLLGIHSPSRVFKSIGNFLGVGFADGIAGTQKQVTAATGKLVQLTKDAFDKREDLIKSSSKKIASIEAKLANTKSPKSSTALKGAERRQAQAKERLAKAQKAAAKSPSSKSAKTELANAKKAVSNANFAVKSAKAQISASDKKTAAKRKDLKTQLAAAKAEQKAAKNLIKTDQRKLLAKLAADQKRLNGLAGQRDQITAKLKSAQSGLASLKKERADYEGKLVEKFVDSGNVTGMGRSSASILKNLTKTRDGLITFQTQIAQLKAKGLNSDAIDQIVQAGVGEGSATAKALLAGGSDTIAQVNSLQKQIGESSKSVANTAGDSLYAAGIRAAEGLVKGLQSQEKQITAQMEKIAKSMVTTTTKALGIHSPSRVFRDEVGAMIPAGLIAGVEGGRRSVDRSVAGLVSVPSVSSIAPASAMGAQGSERAGSTMINMYTHDPREAAHLVAREMDMGAM